MPCVCDESQTQFRQAASQPAQGWQESVQNPHVRFRRTVRSFYRRHARPFPWRETRDPYAILVSEVMLQQTQTDRVVPKYREFLRRFPSFQALARAEIRDLLSVWQGLGYNRRALALKRCAVEVVERYAGELPSDPALLVRLPGIGAYTAGAVSLFAFDQPGVFIETNIRAVFIHFFFPRRRKVRDEEIRVLVEVTLPRRSVREWYYALMDYGVMLKGRDRAIGRRSAHYVRQSPFKGSRREIRGAVLRVLVRSGGADRTGIENAVRCDRAVLDEVLKDLSREGFISCFGGRYRVR